MAGEMLTARRCASWMQVKLSQRRKQIPALNAKSVSPFGGGDVACGLLKAARRLISPMAMTSFSPQYRHFGPSLGRPFFFW